MKLKTILSLRRPFSNPPVIFTYMQDQKKLFSKADIDESSDLSRDEVVALNYNVLFHKYPRLGQKALAYEGSMSSLTL